MNRIAVAAVASAGLIVAAAGGARAQNWTGPEVGVQAGYGWGTSSGHFTDNNIPGVVPYSFDPDGVVGGIHGGYDWELRNHLVLGLEGDLDGSSISGDRSNAIPFRAHNWLRYDGTVRGRVGYAFNRVMVYGTGGFAYGDVSNRYAISYPAGGVVVTDRLHDSDLRTGWTAGGGVAYKITPNWEGDLDYRHLDLGRETFGRHGISDSNQLAYNILTVGLTYRFAPPPPPPPPPPAPMPAAAPAPAPPPPPRTFLVFFGFDRYNLTQDARQVIRAAADAYRKTGSARVDVAGYTDLAGTQAYNLRLSRRRADAVAAYLAGLGVPRNVMEVKWFGKEHPRVPTPDGVREPQNRRVEIGMH